MAGRRRRARLRCSRRSHRAPTWLGSRGSTTSTSLLVDAPDGLLEDARRARAARPGALRRRDRRRRSAAGRAGPRPVHGRRARLGGGRARSMARACPGGRRSGSPAPRSAPTAAMRAGSSPSASIAVQRALGVPAEPVLVAPDPPALVEVARGAGLVVVGLTERWRRDGLGPRAHRARDTAVRRRRVLVRRGVRPGGLAPRDSDDALHVDDRRLSVISAPRGAACVLRQGCVRGPAAALRRGARRMSAPRPAPHQPARASASPPRRRAARGSRHEPPACSRSSDHGPARQRKA